IKIKMPDGVYLTADLFVPKTNEKLPVILIRTPYGKHQHARYGEFWARNGYVAIVQNTRGKWGSEGEFSPFVDELTDGLATLDWIQNQEWCNGNVGMFGSSYLTYAAMVVASKGHPALKSIYANSGWLTGERIMNPGGAFHLQLSLPWMLHEYNQKYRSLDNYDLEELFEFLPVSSVFDSLELKAEFWEDHIEGDVSLLNTLSYKNINIPIFHVTGWYDFVHDASLDIYRETKNNGSLNKLIVGPWFHGQEESSFTEVGDENFGPVSILGSDSVKKLSLLWFDHTLKGIENEIVNLPNAKVFVMGQNQWKSYNQFPPENIQPEKWYITSNKGANSLNGDGLLTTELHKKAEVDTFTFDPYNPVPTYGGANFHFMLHTIGIKNQRNIEKRNDVLVYTSDVLENNIEIIGSIQVNLFVSTEGKDTDFTAKLVEVRENGYARIIDEGIVQLAHRNSLIERELVEPNEIYEITIELGRTGISIKKGHKLRLEISSSNFPKYIRNANTGEDPYDAKDLIRVKQTIYCGKKYPSHIVLPIIKEIK
ncbi:CocE/NonD family hydrolase, partial [Bacteroidota bacterium]